MITESFNRKEKLDEVALGREEIRMALDAEYANGRDPLAAFSEAGGGEEPSPKPQDLAAALGKEDVDFWRHVKGADITPEVVTAYRATLNKDSSQARKLFAQYAMGKAQTILMHQAEMDRVEKEYEKKYPKPDEHDQNIRI